MKNLKMVNTCIFEHNKISVIYSIIHQLLTKVEQALNRGPKTEHTVCSLFYIDCGDVINVTSCSLVLKFPSHFELV